MRAINKTTLGNNALAKEVAKGIPRNGMEFGKTPPGHGSVLFSRPQTAPEGGTALIGGPRGKQSAFTDQVRMDDMDSSVHAHVLDENARLQGEVIIFFRLTSA